MMNASYSRQTGSGLFYILIAIALLAAFTAVMVRGSRTNTDMITDDQARIAAQEIIAYGNAVAEAVQKLRLRGCTDMQISFASSVFTLHQGTPLYIDGHNPNAPLDGSCDVFKSAGGNIAPIRLPETHTYNWTGIANNNTGRGAWQNARAQVPSVGTEGKEELLFLATYIKREVCMKINDMLGVQNPSNLPAVITNTLTTYNGSYDDNDSKTFTDPNLIITGKTAFCISHATGTPQDTFFTQVLLAR